MILNEVLDTNMKLNPITLSFSGELASVEEKFLDDYFIRSINQMRFSLLLGIFFYAIFGILDAELSPETKRSLWLIRYGIVCPSVLGVVLFSFSARFNKRIMQISLSLLMLLASSAIIFMTIIIPPPVSYSYYTGIILIFMFGYTFIKLRFIWATLVGWGVVIFYQIAALITDTPFVILIQNNFFFISANIIGMVAGYSIEYYTRKDYATTRFVRKTFGRYLSDKIVDIILDSKDGLSFGGQRKSVVVMITDLRGFTAISERLNPDNVVSMLNNYFEKMVKIATGYGGTIIEITGDSLLVIFGAPTQLSNKEQRSIACAIAMQNAMVDVNEQNIELGLPELEMGIGLNLADVVVGNIGSTKRSKYAVVGSGVNITSRIESFTVGGQVFISDSLFRVLGQALAIVKKYEAPVKGAERALVFYEVVGISGAYNIKLEHVGPTMVCLSKEIPLRCNIVDGKRIRNKSINGSLVKFSQNCAEMKIDAKLDLLTDIISYLNLESEKLQRNGFYGKIISKTDNEQKMYLIRFTSIPPEIVFYLQELQQSEVISLK
jgi:class 3 adenylate cyclase